MALSAHPITLSLRIFALLAVLAVLPACKKPAPSASATTVSAQEPSGGESIDNYVDVAPDDAAMNGAIETAKKTANEFLEALRHPQPTFREFNVKKPYPVAGGKFEHMWIEEVREEGDHLVGSIANDPFETTEVKYGQEVKLKLDEISDWKYLDENRLIGGYTIRYFYDRMTPEEKKAFLDEAGFTME